jgi:hypothetical protein
VSDDAASNRFARRSRARLGIAEYLFSALRQHGVSSRHQPFDFQAGGAQGAGGGRQIGGAEVQRAWLRRAEQADEGSLHGVISSSARGEQTDQDLRTKYPGGQATFLLGYCSHQGGRRDTSRERPGTWARPSGHLCSPASTLLWDLVFLRRFVVADEPEYDSESQRRASESCNHTGSGLIELKNDKSANQC